MNGCFDKMELQTTLGFFHLVHVGQVHGEINGRLGTWSILCCTKPLRSENPSYFVVVHRMLKNHYLCGYIYGMY